MSLTITATLNDLTGTSNAGWATFTLVGYGSTPPQASGVMIVDSPITAYANGSGDISQVILGNDVITPTGTTYVVQVFSKQGSPITAARYSLTGTGTLDLSSLTPLGSD